MKRNILILSFILFSATHLQAQYVSAGANDTICGHEYVKLSGYLDGDDYLFYHWKSDPTITDTSQLVTWANPTVTTTYYLHGFRPDTCLFVNGDFELGNTGFTSAYTYSQAMPNLAEGHYKIATNGAQGYAGWLNIGDHTTGTGNFMCINAAVVPNVTLWANSISNIQPNTRYVFYTWVSTMIAREVAEAPLLQFSINGALLDAPFRGPFPITNGWEQFFTVWESGNNTVADFKIVNQSTTSWGNDLGLDDIFFAILLEEIDSVTIYIQEPYHSYDTVELCHHQSYVFADTILIESGDYTKHLYTELGCDSIIHLHIKFHPEMNMDLGEDQIICKEDSTYTILRVPPDFTQYQWSTGDSSYQIAANETGTYSVTVYNEIGCEVSDEVHITFVEKPDLTIENLTENFCLEYKSQLKVHTPFTDILWSTGAIEDEIEVTEFGTYYVTVSEHHCQAVDSVVITFCCPIDPGIPNVITPSDHNGINDHFEFLQDFPFQYFTLYIYDRWGKLVYKNSDPTIYWNGEINGTVLKGLYYYVVDLDDGCSFHGSLTVL
ncbi:MAG: gliding motility-associated C-terminal domain-containing protein [Bacteroidales bacterium]|jgi:gliding motility-associated-like protein|nr:gliding motility-associated C-terminal domain-containing protein [Bacteroidales bacterium]